MFLIFSNIAECPFSLKNELKLSQKKKITQVMYGVEVASSVGAKVRNFLVH